MMDKQAQQVIALAGLAQAAWLVAQLAQHGTAAQDKLNTCLNSLFVTRPDSTVSVYGSLSRIRLGLNILEEIFGNESEDLKSPAVISYLLGMIHLQGRLRRQTDMLDRIAGELARLEENFGSPPYDFHDYPEITGQLGSLYQDTISKLPFRIQVKGHMNYLQNPQTAACIRATLLSGIRSAVLWHQLGGRRWHFLLYRKRILKSVRQVLEQSSAH